MKKLRLILALSGLAFGTAVGAAPTRDPPGGPEQLAAMCIQQGCWNPAVNGVTSVYVCAGGDLVRTQFNVAANRLDLTRGDGPAVSSLTLQHTSATGPVVYGDGDLTWSVTAPGTTCGVSMSRHSAASLPAARMPSKSAALWTLIWPVR